MIDFSFFLQLFQFSLQSLTTADKFLQILLNFSHLQGITICSCFFDILFCHCNFIVCPPDSLLCFT